MRISITTALAVVLVLCLSVSTQAFAPTQGRAVSRPNDSILFSSQEEAPSDDTAAPTDPPKPAVKCPDCDLCDGSGRIA